MLGGQTPYGDTPDISSISDFDFYEPIWYYEEMSQFPEPKCYIQHKSGTPIVRSTVQAITEDQKMTDEVKKELQELDQAIQDKIGSFDTTHHDVPNYFQAPTNATEAQDSENENDYKRQQFEPMEEAMSEADDYDPETYV
jgi:hypothetical protein